MNSYDYFIKPGQMTDPGKYAELLFKLKPDLSTLCKIVQGLCIHVFWADHYGVTIPADRMGELQIRDTSTRLGRILSMSHAPLDPVQKSSGPNCLQLPPFFGDLGFFFTISRNPCPCPLRICRLFPARSLCRSLGLRILEPFTKSLDICGSTTG